MISANGYLDNDRPRQQTRIPSALQSKTRYAVMFLTCALSVYLSSQTAHAQSGITKWLRSTSKAPLRIPEPPPIKWDSESVGSLAKGASRIEGNHVPSPSSIASQIDAPVQQLARSDWAAPVSFTNAVGRLPMETLIQQSSKQAQEWQSALGRSIKQGPLNEAEARALWDRAQKRCPGWQHAFDRYVLPNWDKLLAAGLIGTILLYPDQVFDAAGNVIEDSVREITDKATRVAGTASQHAFMGILRGFCNGLTKIGWVGGSILCVGLVVLSMWTLSRIKKIYRSWFPARQPGFSFPVSGLGIPPTPTFVNKYPLPVSQPLAKPPTQ